jgi:hypothetical protein
MSRLNYPHAKLSFEAPKGFRPVARPGFLWCGTSASGERITVTLWKRNTGLTELKPGSSAQVYAHLHPKLSGKTFLRGPESGSHVGGALSSFSGIERLQYGKPFRSYQMLTLFDSNLYLFEYVAPMPKAAKGVVAFAHLLDTVKWTGMAPAPKEAAPPSRTPQEQTLSQKLGLPYLPASRAVSTKAGGVLSSGL